MNIWGCVSPLLQWHITVFFSHALLRNPNMQTNSALYLKHLSIYHKTYMKARKNTIPTLSTRHYCMVVEVLHAKAVLFTLKSPYTSPNSPSASPASHAKTLKLTELVLPTTIVALVISSLWVCALPWWSPEIPSKRSFMIRWLTG